MGQMRDQVSKSTATEGGRVMSSNRLRRQGRIAWKLVAARRDADTLAGPNGDMLARAEVMHRFGVGRSTQGEQQGEGQSGTHPRQSYRTSPADVHTSGHDPKMQLLHDRSNWRDHRARRGCDRRGLWWTLSISLLACSRHVGPQRQTERLACRSSDMTLTGRYQP